MTRRGRTEEGAARRETRWLGNIGALLALVFVVKVGIVAGSLVTGDAALARSATETLGTEERPETHPALAPVPVAAPIERPDSPGAARSLLESLAARQADLERRERELSAREDRIEIYEQDLTEKIAYLENLQKDISRESKDMEEQDSEAASGLAKVYAAMKPSEAAPLLDRLDDETVLRILAHMRAKQIGELLPLLDRDKAIVLTQALAAGR